MSHRDRQYLRAWCPYKFEQSVTIAFLLLGYKKIPVRAKGRQLQRHFLRAYKSATNKSKMFADNLFALKTSCYGNMIHLPYRRHKLSRYQKTRSNFGGIQNKLSEYTYHR